MLLKSLLGGTSKIWAGTNGGTVKELSLSGHTHSASDITSGTLSVSRGGTGTTSLSSLAGSLSPYMPSGGGSKTSLISKSGTTSITGSSVGTVTLGNINCPLGKYVLIVISFSGSKSGYDRATRLLIGNQTTKATMSIHWSDKSWNTVTSYFESYSGYTKVNPTTSDGSFSSGSSLSVSIECDVGTLTYNLSIYGVSF